MLEDEDGRVCACVAVDLPAPGSMELHRLYVRPDRRGAGLAAMLVRLAEDRGRAYGAGRAHLWSDTRFSGAHRLYERLGYEATGDIRELGDISQSAERRYEKALLPE